MSPSGTTKIPARVYGNSRIDPEYKKCTLSEPEIALFKAIDRDHKALKLESAHFNMSIMLKGLNTICPNMLTSVNWKATLADEPDLPLDAEGNLADRDNPVNTLKGIGLYGHEPPKEVLAFFQRNPSFPELKDKLLQYIATSETSDFAKREAAKFLEISFPKLERNYEICVALDKANFFNDWVRGDFNYPESIFHSPEEMEFFGNVLKVKLINYLHEDAFDVPVEEQRPLVIRAVDTMMERIAGHEAGLRQQLEAEAEAEATRIRRAEERRVEKLAKAAEKAEKAKAEFMAKHQPYSMGAAAARIVDDAPKSRSLSARWFDSAVKEARATLDLRQPHAKELGDLLLSEQNVAAMATALELRALPPPKAQALAQNASRLAALSHTADAKANLDALLGSDGGTLLLATLTLPPAVYADYANALMAAGRREQHFDEICVALTTKYGFDLGTVISFCDDPTLESDPDVAPLFTARRQADAAKAFDMPRARAALGDAIRASMQGMPCEAPVRIFDAAGTPAVLQDQKPDIAPKTTLPETAEPKPAWRPILAENALDWKVSEKPDHIHIFSSEFKEIGADITIRHGDLDTAFTALVKHLVNEREHKRLNLESIGELCSQYGFEEQEGKALHHPQYGLTIAMNGSQTQNATALREAFTAVKACQEKQAATIEEAASLKIPEPDGGYPRYMTPGQLASLRTAIDDERQRIAKAADAAAHEPPPIPEEKIWRPEQGKTLMIFDAALMKLAAPRDANGHTWSDIVKHTASLPNVTVVIPSVIADWEMRGRIPDHSKGFRDEDAKQIDMHYMDGKHPEMVASLKVMDDLAEEASRVRIVGTNGHKVAVLEHRGTNPNIVIMETTGDKDLWNKIDDIHKRLAGNNGAFYGELTDKIRKHGHGEQAINRIIKELPYKVPMMVVGDDLRYFEGTNSPAPPPTTLQGMPVGQASVTSYIRAHTSHPDRCNLLQASMSDPEEVSKERIEGDLVDHGRMRGESKADIIFPYNKCGRGSDGRLGDSIDRLIGKGVRATLYKEPPKDTPAEGEGAGADTKPPAPPAGRWTKKRPPAPAPKPGSLEEAFRDLDDPPDGNGALRF